MTQALSTSPPSVSHETCRCDVPLPAERAERKGAAAIVCVRCGGRIPPRLR